MPSFRYLPPSARLALGGLVSLTVGLGVAPRAVAHYYSNNGVAEEDKHIKGPISVTRTVQGGQVCYVVGYTDFAYRDVSPLFYPAEQALQALEQAYCVAPNAWGSDPDQALNCHPSNHGSQAALYSGSVSPHGQVLRIPADPKEFQSYLAGSTNGGGNNQNGGFAQNATVAGTRLSQINNEPQMDAAVARMYAFQFAAQANGKTPNSVDGMVAGANAYAKMQPAAQMFMQVAALYKGQIDFQANGKVVSGNAGGNYNNAKLAALLRSKGIGTAGGVGNNDVETLGAVAKALNNGQITLSDIINSGAINDQARYNRIIDFVESGTYAMTLADYDRSAFNPNSTAKGNRNGNTGNATFNSVSAATLRSDQSSKTNPYYQQFNYSPKPSRAGQLAATDPTYRKILELHDLHGVGRIFGKTEAENFAASIRCFMAMAMDGDRVLANLDAHDRNHMVAFDADNNGIITDAELEVGLQKLATFTKAVAQDAMEQSGGIAPGGTRDQSCGIAPTPAPTPVPTPKPTPVPSAPKPSGGY
ncbi:MAG: hypothetical protein VKO21_11780 [Candidatus Sericytochromatia bacterium]|nr:hypothetical protein [Candidatus Sericytochromatia bacterium]